jgi:ABC-type multidrug transport system fused ATPase/permease subunit
LLVPPIAGTSPKQSESKITIQRRFTEAPAGSVLWQQGKTLIMVTHDPGTARYATRTLHLDKGRLVESGLHELNTGANA